MIQTVKCLWDIIMILPSCCDRNLKLGVMTSAMSVHVAFDEQFRSFVTSLAKEVMFLVALVSLSVCLFVCLFVCGQHYSQSYERIAMKFYGRVLSSTSKNWLNFGGDLGIVRWVNEKKNTVIVVAYPDRGEGNDPEPFFFFFFFF